MKKLFDDNQLDYESIRDIELEVYQTSIRFENLIAGASNEQLKKKLKRLRSATLTLLSKINNAFYEDDDDKVNFELD